MKNILMFLAIAVFVVAMFLLYDAHIEYALVAIMTACTLTACSIIIEKEEENLILQQQLIEHTLRGNTLLMENNELLRQRTIAEGIANRYEQQLRPVIRVRV